MNVWILAAAILSVATVFIHVIAGGSEVHQPYLDSELPVILKAFSSVLWHAVTVVLTANSLALLFAVRQSAMQRPLVLLVTGQYLGFAALLVLYGTLRLGSLAPMPQWIIFIALSALALIGLVCGAPKVRPA